MGLLQAIALEALSGYFPGLDPDSLRVNVLKGRLDLKDVILSPGQVFAFAGFPFRLTRGTIGELGLHVPWASIYSAPVKVSAHRVEVHFAEVLFPESQKQVFEAFRNENSRAKNRMLAEGERAESAITRALQKLFPMLLDRVEANTSDVKLFLHFTTGEVASVCFQEFVVSSTEFSSRASLAKNCGDLAKVIQMKELSISLSQGRNTRFAMGDTGIDLALYLGDGVYSIDLSLQQEIALAIDLSFEGFVHNLEERISCWNSAAKYERPHLPVSEDTKAWFKYALRATCGRKGNIYSELSAEACHEAISSFLEYKRLHVLRLRKGDALNADEEDQIRRLEDLLDADMILLLRSHARTDVMAEEVSAFATKEWLSWIFFDRRMSEEREHLAGEIRKSLSVAERWERDESEAGRASSSRNEAATTLSRSWSSAKLSFAMRSLTICVTSAGCALASVMFGSICCQAELDSAMQSYGIMMTLSNFVLKDGNRYVCRRGKTFDEEQDGVDANRTSHFFEAKVQKPALGDDISVRIQLAPCAFAMDATRLSRYSAIVRMIGFLKDARRTHFVIPEESEVRPRSDGNSPPTGLALDVSTSDVSLLVGSGSAAPDVEMTQIWFLITLGAGNIHVNDMLSNARVKIRCSGSVKDSASVAYQKGLHYRNSSVPNIYPVHNGHLFNVSMSLSVDVSGALTCWQVADLGAHMTSSGVRALFGVLRIIVDSFRGLSRGGGLQESGSSSDTNGNTVAVFRKRAHQIEVVKVKCKLQDDIAECDSRIAATVSATELLVVMMQGSLRKLTLKEANIAEDLYSGPLRLAASSRLPFGVSVESIDISHGTVTDLDATIASLFILLRPESLHDFVAIALRFREVVKNGYDMTAFGKRVVDDASYTTTKVRPPAQLRTSCLIHDVRVECLFEENHVLVVCQNAFVVAHRAVLSGSMDGLLCKDMSGLSGVHSVAIRNVPSSTPRQPDRRALSFNLAACSANIHLHSVQFLALRSFIERVVAMHQVISNAIKRATRSGDSANVGPNVNEDSNGVTRRRTISVQGSDISLRIPLSPLQSDCVCVEASQMTTTVGTDTFVVSLRKASVLTSTSATNPVLITPTSGEELAPNASEWAVMVRGLDLDVSHVHSFAALSSELAKQRRSEWNVQVLSRAALFVTASQVCLLQLIPRSLRSTVTTDDDAYCHAYSGLPEDDRHPDYEVKPTFPILTSYKHFTLRVETQAISVEFLKEDDNGLVISTIACLEVDPIQMSLRKGREDRGNELETLVTKWSLMSQAFQLEDRCFGTPSCLREVITTRQRKGRSHGDARVSEDDLQTIPTVIIEGVTRTDKKGAAKSSLEIQLNGIRVVPSPSFYERVRMFLTHVSAGSESDSTRHTQNPGPRTGAHVEDRYSESLRTEPLHVESAIKESTQSSEKRQVPFRKISWKISDVVIQIFGKGRRVGESSLIVCIGALKTTLLFPEVGGLLSGSQIRARDISVSMNWLPTAVLTAEQGDRGVVSEAGLYTMSNRKSFDSSRLLANEDRRHGFRPGMRTSLFLRHSLTVPRERFRWNFFRQDNDGELPELILAVRSVALRLPSGDSDRLVLLVPSLSVDSRIRSLISFARLLSVVDFLPRFDTDSGILLPAIQFSVNTISLRVKVPTTAMNAVGDVRQLNQVVLRVRCALNGVVGKNVSGLTSSVKLTVDAIDEKKRVWDQICAPCEIELEIHISQDASVSLRGERLVRLVLSPLTARAITGLLLSMSPKQQKPRNMKSRRRAVAEQSQEAIHVTVKARTLTVLISLRGVCICCISEEPRMQFLRLSLRGITILGCVPLATHEEGRLEIVLQDVTLEDTYSWRLYGPEEFPERSVQWTNILVGMREVSDNSGISSRFTSHMLTPNSSRSLSAGLFNVGGVISHSELWTKLKQNHSLSWRMHPVVVCRVSWRVPCENVAAYLHTRGFELNLNMPLAPTLLAWGHSVSDEIRKVRSAYAVPSDRRSTNQRNEQRGCRGLRIGIDHLFVEPINLIVSSKAPPPRVQESFARRAVMWLLGSESVAGITLQIPLVIFNGDFVGWDRFLERIRSIYVNALTSKYVGRQLVSQVPSISRLARVLVTSFLRRRQIDWLLRSETIAPSHQSAMFPIQKSHGLLEIITGTGTVPSTYLQTTVASLTEPDARSKLHQSSKYREIR